MCFQLKDRNGSRYACPSLQLPRALRPAVAICSTRVKADQLPLNSRQSLKKYVQANNKINVPTPAQFDSQFNKALKTGVEKGDFVQPKGPSGPVKLAKKEAKPAASKPASTKTAGEKKPAAKKSTTTKKASTTTKAPAKKPASTTKKAAPKANIAKPRKAPKAGPTSVCTRSSYIA